MRAEELAAVRLFSTDTRGAIGGQLRLTAIRSRFQ